MRFPPPVRITAPLLALVFGLLTTWLDYRLNLHLDLARHVTEVRDLADANGRRLARISETLLAARQQDALERDVKAIADLPLLESGAVVDEGGRIIAGSEGEMKGLLASATPLSDAAALINAEKQPVMNIGEASGAVVSAHPFPIGANATGWVLLEFDRTRAIANAESDARTQLRWMASAMTLLSFALWAVLHFGFAARLAQLAASVRAFGDGKTDAPQVLGGADEVAALSASFATMGARLREREAEQVRLEREVLATTDGERRRIGHDLHDSLGQRLTAASMTTNALIAALKLDAPALTARGEEIGRQLRDAIAEARSLSHGLAPVALQDDGLMAALGALAENTSRGDTVRCVLECAAQLRVPDAEVAGHLYHIAQEGVNNAMKHAGASEIRIGLERREGTLLLEIDDDGEGFDETTTPAKGIGLRVMRYRAKLMGGSLDIGPAPAGGTRISCTIPQSL